MWFLPSWSVYSFNSRNSLIHGNEGSGKTHWARLISSEEGSNVPWSWCVVIAPQEPTDLVTEDQIQERKSWPSQLLDGPVSTSSFIWLQEDIDFYQKSLDTTVSFDIFTLESHSVLISSTQWSVRILRKLRPRSLSLWMILSTLGGNFHPCLCFLFIVTCGFIRWKKSFGSREGLMDHQTDMIFLTRIVFLAFPLC